MTEGLQLPQPPNNKDIPVELTKEQRVHNILQHTPDNILLPDKPTYIHRTATADAVVGIMDTGLDVRKSYDISTTASGLYGSVSGDNLEQRRIDNADKIATEHSPYARSRFAVVIQFPKLSSYQEDPRRPSEKINDYLEDVDLNSEIFRIRGVWAKVPAQYVVGVVNQDSGQYFTKDQFQKSN